MKFLFRLIPTLAVVACLSGITATRAEAQLAQPAGVTQQSLSPELQQAARAGYEAGLAKSTTKAGVYGGLVSLVYPGTGLIFLFFAGDDGLKPDPVQQAHLNGKSEGYTATFIKYYKQTFAARERKAIIIGTIIGSAVRYVVMKKATSAVESSYGYSY